METDFKKKRDALRKNPTYPRILDPENIQDSNSITNLFMTRFEEREEQLEKMHELTKSMM